VCRNWLTFQFFQFGAESGAILGRFVLHCGHQLLLHKLYAGLCHSAPDNLARTYRVTAVKCQAEAFGEINRIRYLHPSASVGDIAYDTVDH